MKKRSRRYVASPRLIARANERSRDAVRRGEMNPVVVQMAARLHGTTPPPLTDDSSPRYNIQSRTWETRRRHRVRRQQIVRALWTCVTLLALVFAFLVARR